MAFELDPVDVLAALRKEEAEREFGEIQGPTTKGLEAYANELFPTAKRNRGKSLTGVSDTFSDIGGVSDDRGVNTTFGGLLQQQNDAMRMAGQGLEEIAFEKVAQMKADAQREAAEEQADAQRSAAKKQAVTGIITAGVALI